MRTVSEHGERVYLEFISRKVELEYVLVFWSSVHAYYCNAFFSKQHPYVFPESPAAAIHVPSESAPSDYPATLPARAFQSKEVMNLPRVSVREADLNYYQRRPELVQTETFVSFDEDQAEYEVFRIPAFITAGQEKISYVVYADEGPEALACTFVDLIDLLRTSERVVYS
jgi:hypothetical protein